MLRWTQVHRQVHRQEPLGEVTNLHSSVADMQNMRLVHPYFMPKQWYGEATCHVMFLQIKLPL